MTSANTEREKAIEEMLEKVDWVKYIHDPCPETVCKMLYDAGYRKVNTDKENGNV